MSLARGLALVAWTASTVFAAPPATDRFEIRARTFDGVAWHDAAVVVVAGARVESLRTGGAGSTPDATLVDIAGAVLTPGFIDCDSALGLSDGRDELPEAASPDLLVADAFAPDEGESRAFRTSGVTLAWLAAGASGVVGGQGALVQPSRAGRGTLFARSHGLCASLTVEASQPERAPSSRPQQRLLLLGLEGSGTTPPGRVRYDDAGSASMAADLEGFLPVGLPSTREAAAELGDMPSILSGLDASTPLDVLRLCAELARTRPFALGSGDAPAGAPALRFAAAALVQAGVPVDRVLVALTSEAGRLGAAGGRGIIAAGRPADLVLWSGHPLSPACRPLRVWVSGEEVHREN